MASPNTIVALVCLAAGSLAIAAPKKAHGEPGAASRVSTRVLRERARLAFNTDELPEALAALRALQNVEPSVDTACMLGAVARRLGNTVEAAENLDLCVAAYRLVPIENDPREAARLEELTGEFAMAQAAVATVLLDAPPGATVTIDERPMGPAGADRKFFLEPGRHDLDVSHGGRTTRRTVTLARGTTRTLDFRAALAPTAPAPPLAPATDPLLIGGWIATGAAVTAGVILIAAASAKSGIADDKLAAAKQAGNACYKPQVAAAGCIAFKETRDTAGDLRDGALGSFVAAGLLGVGTGIYAMTRPTPRSPTVVVGINHVEVRVRW